MQTLARAVAVGILTYGAQSYTLNCTQRRALNVLHNATLRTITGLPRHTKISNLQSAAALPPIEKIIQEQTDQYNFKRKLTHQGATLTAWDKQDCIPLPDFPIPIPPWQRPLLTEPTTTHPIARTTAASRQKRCHRLFTTKQSDEIDIYTDASLSPPNVGTAWVSPDDRSIMGARHSKIIVTPTEAKLLAITHALDYLMYDHRQPIPKKIRILTDSYEAFQELRRPCSTHPSVNQIIRQTMTLQHYGTQVRIDWTPGHDSAAPGNQAAHEAAQEACSFLSSADPVVPDASDIPDYFDTTQDINLPPAIRIHRYKHEKKLRLKQLTPRDHVSDQPLLTRTQEIFINKFYADASFSPETIRKWYYPHINPKCPYCQQPVNADLHHLVWICPKFSRYRNFISPNPDPSIHIDPLTLDQHTINVIIQFATKSGLARVI